MRLPAALLAAFALAAPAAADPLPACPPSPLVLWGDGRHDDAASLNAWFRGENVRWAQSGEPVGPVIAGRSFVLSAPLYVPSGTGRKLERFRMVWPQAGERISGGTIASGEDPDAPPRVSGIVKIGGDPGEGVPFEAPPGGRNPRTPPTNCLVS